MEGAGGLYWGAAAEADRDQYFGGIRHCGWTGSYRLSGAL